MVCVCSWNLHLSICVQLVHTPVQLGVFGVCSRDTHQTNSVRFVCVCAGDQSSRDGADVMSMDDDTGDDASAKRFTDYYTELIRWGAFKCPLSNARHSCG